MSGERCIPCSEWRGVPLSNSPRFSARPHRSRVDCAHPEYIQRQRANDNPDRDVINRYVYRDVDRDVYRDVDLYVYRDVDQDVYRDYVNRTVDRDASTYVYRDVDRNVIETSTDTFFETSTATSFAYETLS